MPKEKGALTSSPKLSAKPAFKRILFKVGGEAFAGASGSGIDFEVVDRLAGELQELAQAGVQVGVVVGGGNLFRGAPAEQRGMERVTADYMGMLATVLNALALQDTLERRGVMTRVQTAIEMEKLAEPYIRRRAIRHMEKGRVVIFAAGTGNPYFSTDTAAALRAIEVGAEVILKATKVDGVYDKDPLLHSDAVRYRELDFLEALRKRLKVMDSTAFSLCMDNNLPIIVFSHREAGTLRRVVYGEALGTVVRQMKTSEAGGRA